MTFNWWFNWTFFFQKLWINFIWFIIKKVCDIHVQQCCNLVCFSFSYYVHLFNEVLKRFSSICSIKFSFVQRIISRDVSSNITIFYWLLIQKSCSSCSTKQLNIMSSQYFNCFCQTYVEALCCFFDTFRNDISTNTHLKASDEMYLYVVLATNPSI